MIRFAVVALVALAAALPAAAKDNPPANAAVNIPTFLQKQQALRKDIETSKKYSHLKADAKQKIFAAQDKLEHLLAGHATVEELNVDDKVAVYNAQSEILAQLDEAEPDRVICSSEAKTGSHLHSVVCTTKRDRDAQRDMVRNMYQNGVKPNCVSVGCSGGN